MNEARNNHSGNVAYGNVDYCPLLVSSYVKGNAREWLISYISVEHTGTISTYFFPFDLNTCESFMAVNVD